VDEFLPLLLDSVELNFRTADDPLGVADAAVEEVDGREACGSAEPP
jgi:hypothetical protein